MRIFPENLATSEQLLFLIGGTNLKNRNQKHLIHNFSFELALWSSFMQFWPFLRGGGSAYPYLGQARQPENSGLSQHYRIEGFFRVSIIESPIMLGNTSPSDSRCKFSSLGVLE